MNPVRSMALARPNAHARFEDEKAPDSVFRRGERWAGPPKVLRVPEVHPRLVRDFDGDAQVGQHGIRMGLRGFFARLAQVLVVEVEEVVILDVGIRRAVGPQVPEGLEQAAGDEPCVGERGRQGIPAREDGGVGGVGCEVMKKLGGHSNTET